MILLADADIIVYAAASIHQDTIKWDEDVTSVTTDLPQAKNYVDSTVERLMRETKCTDVLMALSSVEKNFRYSVLPTYKHNRSGLDRPLLREALNEYVVDTYAHKRKNSVEGDDVLGILATAFPGKYLIATIDKDLRQIPGSHYNWQKREFFKVTKEDGDLWFFTQILTGDPGDGYKGCPGIGKVKAEAILDYQRAGVKPEELNWSYWAGICRAYESKGLTEADALAQARCARILQHTDYDFKKDEVILWNPPQKP
jgi:DNA polymerase I